MDFKSLLSELREKGHSDGQLMTDSAIANEIELQGVEVRGPTIHRLRTGSRDNPSYRLGNAIVAVHERFVIDQPPPKPAQIIVDPAAA